MNNTEIPKPHSIDFLLMLFEKHFSYVPSITMKVYDGLKKEEIKDKHPDISLYDHSKLTAAIAGCMFHYLRETYPEKWKNNELLKDEILNVPKDKKYYPYLLIGGDISGVQKFIYTITSKGALKSLKGRSFYLELLSEHIVSKILEALNLTRCNLVFSGGGHFYILSYNTPSSISAIKKLRAEIDDYLFNEFKGGLQLHLECEEFHPDEFKNASELWIRLSNKLEVSKKRKWPERIHEVLEIEIPHLDCLTHYCEICFREDLPLREILMGDDKLLVCNPCKSQYELGESLKRISEGNYPVIYKFYKEPEEYTIKIESAYYLLKTGWEKTIHQDAKAVYRINDDTAKHYSHPYSIYLPIGLYQHNKLHELSDTVGTFGIDRIAVLRMDVDNLGKIFSQAIPQEHRTFSRMASISRSLNKFFKYHLNMIAEGKEIDNPIDVAKRNIKNNGRMLTIVYSGGDDIFLIGHWLDITEAAIDINNYFKKYTGNKFISISGGITVNHEKYPVYQYAKDAEEAENLAKKNTKNAIALFGNRRFSWDDIGKVLDRVKLFIRFLKSNGDHLAVDEDKLPKTFFYRLLSLARRFKEDGVLVLPKAAYLLSRARFGKGKDEDILKMKEVVMTANSKEWIVTETVTMWTLMLMRKGGKDNART
ncbi:MAG: type III-A CRISPR-associated protein Cas10/Csm1 [Thermodesulfovibrionales bacterium]